MRIGDGRKYARDLIYEQWRADTAGRAEDRALEASAMCFGPEDQILCAATLWARDVAGWKTVECILVLGASESV